MVIWILLPGRGNGAFRHLFKGLAANGDVRKAVHAQAGGADQVGYRAAFGFRRLWTWQGRWPLDGAVFGVRRP